MKQIKYFALFLLLVVLSCSTAYNPPSISKEGGTPVVTPSEIQAGGGNEGLNKKLIFSVGRIAHPPYRLMPGDTVRVSVFGVEELQDLTGKIDSTGKVSLPLVGTVKIGGLTIGEAKKVLQRAFRKYVTSPKVNLEITEYNGFRVSVLGEVEKPDVYSLKGTRTVLDVLAQAGGLKDDASHTIILTHLGPERHSAIYINLEKLVNNWKFSKDLMLQPGDILYVPKADNIYVDGFVRKPNAYPLTRPTTVTDAITEAGGMSLDADPTQVVIYRRNEAGNKKIIRVDINKIRNGEQKNVRLEPNDVVIVPSSGIKVFVYHFFGVGVGPSGLPSARAGGK